MGLDALYVDTAESRSDGGKSIIVDAIYARKRFIEDTNELAEQLPQILLTHYPTTNTSIPIRSDKNVRTEIAVAIIGFRANRSKSSSRSYELFFNPRSRQLYRITSGPNFAAGETLSPKALRKLCKDIRFLKFLKKLYQ